MKNRVAKLVQLRKIEIFEEEIPKLKEGQILVAMKSVGICGSDMHYFKEGGLGSFKNPLPMYMGHEPSGVIVDSNGSSKFKDGEPVKGEEIEMDFQDLNWPRMINAVRFHSPVEGDGGGATYFFDPTTGITYHRAGYW